MDYTTVTYVTYLGVSAGITVGVARTLVKNGRVFLVDAFAGNEVLADSVNHLLAVGFYLINLGYVALNMQAYQAPEGVAGVLEALASKLGHVLVTLGLMHFFNLWLFSRMRRKGLARLEPPPVRPDEFLAPLARKPEARTA